MKVGELVYQQAIKDGYNPALPDWVLSDLAKAAETYREAMETMREPLKHAKEVASSMAEIIRPQMEVIKNIHFPKIPEIPSRSFIPSHLYGDNDELLIPVLSRPVQEVRIVNLEDIGMVSTKREKEFVTASYPLPQNAAWESLDIQFIDGHIVKVSYPNMESRKFDFKDMGFVNMKTANPDLKWELLRAIADNDGALTHKKWDAKFGRNIKYELNEGLKRFFGIKKNPIPHYTKKRGYEPLFSLRKEK